MRGTREGTARDGEEGHGGKRQGQGGEVAAWGKGIALLLTILILSSSLMSFHVNYV
jgi:hypothetical protein